MLRNDKHRTLAAPVVVLAGLIGCPSLATAQGLRPSAGEATRRMEAAAGGPLEIGVSPVTGLAFFVGSRHTRGIPLTAPASSTAGERALSFLDAYGAAFGIADRSRVAVRTVSGVDEVGMEHVRVQQVHAGVPVTAGELVIHLRGFEVVAANGEMLADLDGVGSQPVVTAAAAAEVVRARLLKHFGVDDATLSEPRLEILNRSLLEDGRFPTHLAWYVEARRLDLRERLWIDAESETLLLQFSQITRARNRRIHNAGSTSSLPGTLVRVEGGVPTGNADVDAAYDYSGDTYDYYATMHGRDSYDGAGAALVSTVDFCPSPGECPFVNAFWNGTQMVYGDGFPAADDVDAHELTHAVTEHTASLFYYQQSGALNESFSDIFGETVDLTNGAGTDTASVRWEMGEDVPFFGAIRDMMDPTVFGDPGKASDDEFVCQDPGGDRGGVHSNSGVPNHAYALMVDGGSYNGFTVTGIGLAKAGKIEYRVLSQYLVSGSGFLDTYFALPQACFDLVGTAGITAADCAEVMDAVEAVELWYYWRCSDPQQWQFEACLEFPPSSVVFADDLESGGGSWLVSSAAGSVAAWYLGDFFATSGTLHLWGENRNHVNDSRVYKASPVVIPSDAYLYFRHSFGFENSGTTYYDGGVVELSTNGGSTWFDAGALIDHGALYGGTLSTGFSNPLGGRSAFVGDSYGYTTTRLGLSGFAGQSLQVRFRVGSDSLFNDYGWFIDDIGIYRCLPGGAIFVDDFELGNTSAWSSTVQ